MPSRSYFHRLRLRNIQALGALGRLPLSPSQFQVGRSATYLREFLEVWMYRVPVSARANLIGRLRDRNDINHRAAKYELLLYAFWRIAVTMST